MPATKSKPNNRETIDFSAQFSRLSYRKGDQQSALPIWAEFFLELGAGLAEFRADGVRYVAALALPTRSYAVPFLGVGFSFAYFQTCSEVSQEHINLIRGLPNGASVRYLDGNGRLKKAIKRDLMSYQGRELVGIQDEGEGNKTVYLPLEKISRVEVSDEQDIHLPKRQKGRRIEPPSPLLGALLADRSYEYVFQTVEYGVVIGSFSSICEESQAELLFRSERGPTRKGSLQELFRLEGTSPASTGHRFAMHHASNVAPPNGRLCGKYPVAIFDGSNSFTKWKEHYRTHNWIIALDRTEPNFAVAAGQVNLEYANRSEEGLAGLSLPVPLGVELMLFCRDT